MGSTVRGADAARRRRGFRASRRPATRGRAAPATRPSFRRPDRGSFQRSGAVCAGGRGAAQTFEDRRKLRLVEGLLGEELRGAVEEDVLVALEEAAGALERLLDEAAHGDVD